MLADLAILRHLLRGQPKGGTHRDRLERFYRGQASGYDRFRERLLAGRRELIRSLPLEPGAHVVELGGGTGRNLEFFDDLRQLGSVTLVDLCPSLLEQAQRRCQTHGWTNVRCIEADATRFGPAHPVDCVYLSYALTMIPDWFAAVDNALAMLRPGGLLAVVDFYVARRHPRPGGAAHGAFTRTFWPLWFGHDGVHLSSDHLPYLLQRTDPVSIHEGMNRVPFMGHLQAPYYRYVGRVRPNALAPGPSSHNLHTTP
jgi:S-adenosylmethionine-diacylgycerolhomoserine-N-methlytransferase